MIEYLNETEWAFLNTVIQNQNKEMDEIEDAICYSKAVRICVFI